MAKKRRRPHNRPPGSAAVRTTDRPDGPEADEPDGNGRARPGRSRTDERGPGAASRSRAEKKELARRQREEVRRRVRRAQRTRQLAWIAGVGVVIAVGVFLLVRPDEPTVRPETLPGELTTEAPWDANADLAAERADLIDLPGHTEPLAMHNHVDLQVFVNGEAQNVPVSVGIDDSVDPADIESLHTHSPGEVVHIESGTVSQFTLGEFFDVWGVRLSGTCLGGYCQEGQDRLRAFVGGEEVTGPIRDVPLDDQSVIVVAYGTDAELPDPIPSTFDFASIQP